jgi:hypothetical protein
MELQNGDILICTSNRFIPSLIKLATKSKWTHTAQYFEVEGIPGIIEAQMDGINWKPLIEWQNKYGYEFIVYRRERLIKVDWLYDRAFSKAGHVGYDFVSFVLRQPFKLLTGKWKYRGEHREVKRMICSEYTAWIYDIKFWWKLTPDDVERFLSRSPRYKLITK